MLQDLRFALRSLRKRPAFALLAILTVALGIGINVAMYTIADGVLWKPLPYVESDRLVKFSEMSSSGMLNCSYPNSEDWKTRSGAFEDIVLERPFPLVTLRLTDSVETVATGFTHANLFSLLRVQPVRGRLFTAEEDTAGAEPAGVISDRAWERYFGRDPNVIGRRLRALVAIEGKQADSIVIVGVLPPDFRYDNRDLWLPLNRFWGKVDADRGNHWFSGVGRLKSGVTLQQARASLDRISRDLEQQYPSTNKGVRTVPESMIDYSTGKVRTPLLLLFAAVGFVLLIACSNVIHLLMARTVGRGREIAVRLALGADRARLLRLLCTESLVIAIAGGALGILFSSWAVQWAIASQPRLLPRAAQIHVDTSALLYAIAITAGTLLILGIIPALSARVQAVEAMQSVGRGGMSRRRQRVGWGLIAVEIAMASMLLMGAGLMIQTLRNLTQVSLGYEPDNVLAVEFGLSPFQYENQAAVIAANQHMLDAVRGMPGFVSAGFAAPFNIGGNGMLPPVSLPGRDNALTLPLIAATSISPGLLETLRIPLRAGRFFQPHVTGREEAIVNEEFARRFFPGESAVGKLIDQAGVRQIVGVVGNTRLQGPISKETPEVYWLDEGVWPHGTLLIRFAGDPASAITGLRRRIKAVEPGVRLDSLQPLRVAEDLRTALQRFTRGLLLAFAGLAVLLATLGIYGVASYGVAQRRREIGVRIALGASAGDVTWLVLRQTFGATLAGGVAGAIGGGLLAKLLASQFYGVTPREPSIYAAVLGLVAVVALVASVAPVFTASRIDPAVSLRQE
jgi:putative ABC transport system permease protein